jgi:hypothetical protein
VPRSTPPAPLPGGIALPGALFLTLATGFVVTFLNPSLASLGGLSVPGLCVLGGVITLFWLLAAMGRRPPSAPPRE